MQTENILKKNKNTLVDIIDEFEVYYAQNHQQWSIKDMASAHQILGTLILTYKKVEHMELAIEYFKTNDLMDVFNLELEEVNIIIDYYYNVFIQKGA